MQGWQAWREYVRVVVDPAYSDEQAQASFSGLAATEQAAWNAVAAFSAPKLPYQAWQDYTESILGEPIPNAEASFAALAPSEQAAWEQVVA